jgi:predicted alternative tryptophan synthase beta-subunit
MAFSLGNGVILGVAVFQAERRACPELAEGISRYDTVCNGRSLGPLVKMRRFGMTPREVQNSN